MAEKTARLRDQEQRFPGMRIKGELQPSFALIDFMAQIKETNCVVWIPPSKCSKRDTEIQNQLGNPPPVHDVSSFFNPRFGIQLF